MEDHPTEPERPQSPQRAWLVPVLGALGLVGVVGVWGWWSARKSGPADDGDPRRTYPTPFRNVRPEVKYVGDAVCARCHRNLADSYHGHPMGRSAALIGKAVPIENYAAGANNPMAVEGYRLCVEGTAEGIVHHVSAKGADGNPLPQYALVPELVIGSGTRGRSYLATENGAVWQSPISWFSHEARWDLSPSFDLGTGGRRAISANCLFCHVDRVEPVPRALNRYRTPLLTIQAAIGC